MTLRALDLFCCAGGASMGLHEAGFEVTGVDVRPQPRYPFAFHQADALTFPLVGFDFVWASPPCQAHTAMKSMHNAKRHPDLIAATRERLGGAGVPYVIENVVGAPIDGFTLCGTMFGLGVPGAELRRHRLFESSFLILAPHCQHRTRRTLGVYGGHVRDRRRRAGSAARGREDFTLAEGQAAMGIDWMTLAEMSQAIPPAFGAYIGRAARTYIERSRREAA